jgi:iron uptake system component EfeO
MTRIRPALFACAALLAFSLTGCVQSNGTESGATRLTVESTVDSCATSVDSAPRGSVVFTVKNSGDQETEFYLLSEDGSRVVGEVEHIGPDTSRDLTVSLEPGTYFTVCKPGMTGDGVGRAEFTVTE